MRLTIPLVVADTAAFLSAAKAVLTDEEREHVVLSLAVEPDQGDVIEGTAHKRRRATKEE